MKFMDNYKSKFKKEYVLIKENDEDEESPFKEKKSKDKKIFNVGDVVKCLDPKGKKLPPDCIEYLITFSKYTVLQVSENLNIDIGMVRNSEPFFFNPNRFELVDGTAPIRKGNEEKSFPRGYDEYLKRKKEKVEDLKKEEEEALKILKEKEKKKINPHHYTVRWDDERWWQKETGEEYKIDVEEDFKDPFEQEWADKDDWIKKWRLMQTEKEKLEKDKKRS